MPEITTQKSPKQDSSLFKTGDGINQGLHELIVMNIKNIDDIDKVAWWPLVPGWWVLISIALLIIFKNIVSYIHWLFYKKTWQYKIITELNDFAYQLGRQDAQNHAMAILIRLSELIKRLAMHQYSRKECAALQGSQWLKWLHTHDKHKFDWEKYGILLTKNVYSKPGTTSLPLSDIKKLIEAIRRWVV